MRLIVLVGAFLVTACDPYPVYHPPIRDAGIDAGVDAGVPDAGMICDPGAKFCSGANVGVCSEDGREVEVWDSCARSHGQGTCSAASTSPCVGDGGSAWWTYPVWAAPGLWCCVHP